MKKIFLLIIIFAIVLIVFIIKKPYRYEENILVVKQKVEDENRPLIKIIKDNVGQKPSQNSHIEQEGIASKEDVVDYSVLSFYQIQAINFSEKNPFAMIVDKRTDQVKRYYIGDILDGWRIVSIDRKEVILENKDIKMALMYEIDLTQGILKVGENKWTFTKQMVLDSLINLDKISQEIASNNEINFDFLFSKDKTGITLQKIGEKSILKDLGLQDGDKILKLNDKDLKSFEIIINLAKDILNKGTNSTLELEVDRNGALIKLYYDIPSISAAQLISQVFGSFFSSKPSSN